jgi:hypothetical protein
MVIDLLLLLPLTKTLVRWFAELFGEHPAAKLEA